MQKNRNKEIVLGIDPGTLKMGWALIEVEGLKANHLKSGTLNLNSKDILARRLVDIENHLSSVIEKFKPTVLVVERLFHHKNSQSALKLGHARGVVIMLAAKNNLVIKEYTPTSMKKVITGHGRASKENVQHMIKLMLKLDKKAKMGEDTSDALGLALCYRFLR